MLWATSCPSVMVIDLNCVHLLESFDMVAEDTVASNTPHTSSSSFNLNTPHNLHPSDTNKAEKSPMSAINFRLWPGDSNVESLITNEFAQIANI